MIQAARSRIKKALVWLGIRGYLPRNLVTHIVSRWFKEA